MLKLVVLFTVFLAVVADPLALPDESNEVSHLFICLGNLINWFILLGYFDRTIS